MLNSPCPHSEGIQGEQNYVSILFEPWHYMEGNSQPCGLATLPPGRNLGTH